MQLCTQVIPISNCNKHRLKLERAKDILKRSKICNHKRSKPLNKQEAIIDIIIKHKKIISNPIISMRERERDYEY